MSVAHEDERRARLTLSLVSEPGDWGFAGARPRARGARAALRPAHRSRAARAADRGSGATRRGRRRRDDGARRAARRALPIPGDDEWPVQLDDLHGVEPLHERAGVPIGLWVRGPLRLDSLADAVALVGSRSSSGYGEQIAADIAAEIGLAGEGRGSGAAYCIDYAAHRGAVGVDVLDRRRARLGRRPGLPDRTPADDRAPRRRARRGVRGASLGRRPSASGSSRATG